MTVAPSASLCVCPVAAFQLSDCYPFHTLARVPDFPRSTGQCRVLEKALQPKTPLAGTDLDKHLL